MLLASILDIVAREPGVAAVGFSYVTALVLAALY
jgi:hypothetical protein